MKKFSLYKILDIFLIIFFSIPLKSFAFPIYAQQAYENPREANGRIVCANCHLAQKPTELESPSSVLPNSVFELNVKIPYDKTQQQLLGNGQKGGLNVGAVVLLPEGFKLAPKEKLDIEFQKKIKGIYITPYSSTRDNILIVGPISGDKYSEIPFPILAPDPNKNKKTFFVKYPIYVGANRGRGQIYPNGEKTNNNVITSNFKGKINQIKEGEKNTEISVLLSSGKFETQLIPKGLGLKVKENDNLYLDQPLTINPNVGGFGQAETEVVLQNPIRIYTYIGLCFLIIITQSIFVFKKKQFEKVQIAELDF